jgi:hypothetical protein
MRTVLLIDNVNMGKGHDSLTELARSFRVNPARLGAGEVLMFLNRKRDKLKVMGAEGKVIGYLRMPSGQKIDLNAIQYLPKTFNPELEINYEQALRESLITALARTPRTTEAHRRIYSEV